MSLAWLAGQRGPDRSGESWSQVIEQWLHLEHVMADGGQGLERGVKLTHAARREAQEPATDAPAPITMGLDVFHTQREVERVLQRLWNRVERQIEGAVKADAKLEQAKRRGQDPRGVAGHATTFQSFKFSSIEAEVFMMIFRSGQPSYEMLDSTSGHPHSLCLSRCHR
jgi:hypothetical protein